MLEQLDTIISFAVVMLLFSLQITVLVQMTVASCGLRGWNLKSGLEQLLKQIDPDSKGRAGKIAKAVLGHPALAPTKALFGVFGRRLATALSPDEFVRVLQDLQGNPDVNPRVKIDDVAQSAIGRLLSKFSGATPGLAGAVERIAAELDTKLAGQKQVIEDTVREVMEQKRQFTMWFDTIMDRTTDRFIRWTRWLTVVFAVILVLALNIDSERIFQQLSMSSELRGRLLASVDSTLTEAEKLQSDLKGAAPLATRAIEKLRETLKEQEAGQKLANLSVPKMFTRREGEAWLNGRIKDASLPDSVVTDYDKAFEEVTIARLKELGASYDSVEKTVEESQISLLLGPKHPRQNVAGLPLPTRGELLSIAFLSLGAPFWFDALSKMAKLRPVIAGKLEKKEAA